MAFGILASALLWNGSGAPEAQAGSGQVNADGTIDITLNFRFPPTAADLANAQNQVVAASQVLWDASEGQLRLGNVTLTCGSVNEDLADMWVFAESGRAGVSFRTDGSGLADRGRHINQYLPNSTGIVIAHEFGHLALGLGDEYSEQNRFGACWGYGRCIETGNLTEQNHCLMQQPGGFTQTEFCTAAGHDTLLGDGLSCATMAVPHGCTINCEFFNHTTGLYETTQQTALSNRSCWQHVVVNFPFLAAPAGLPASAAPAGFVNPTFIDQCDATDTVMLILDRSGSMNWNTSSDTGEVCGNGIDDDGDGTIDETDDCTGTRLEFLQAAARAWLNLANGQGVRAGVVSFNDSATLDEPFQEVDGTTLPGLTAAVDGLVAGGNTAIGTALTQTIFTFDAETSAVNKTAFLISDGKNTAGPDPSTVVGTLQSRGIRVFTIGTGEASDDETLTEISGATEGANNDSPDASSLVSSFTQQWARYRNGGILIPKIPYSLNADNGFSDEQSIRNAEVWSIGRERAFIAEDPKKSPFNQFFQFVVAEDTERVSLVFGGDMGDMGGFGLQLIFQGPPGAGPDFLDTTVGDPFMRVVEDSHFLLAELIKPNPGVWEVEVIAGPGADPIQTGNLTVITDHPQADLFTDLDRHVVRDVSRPLQVSVNPLYHSTLYGVNELSAMVIRPDGSKISVPLETDVDEGGGDSYFGQFAAFNQPGIYEMRFLLRTDASAFNDPGESIWADAPSVKFPIPEMELTSVEYFIVPEPEKPRVDRVDPPRGCPGDVIQIFGANFGHDIQHVSAVVLDGRRSIPLEVLDVAGDRMAVRVGPIPPDARPGQIVVSRGLGQFGETGTVGGISVKCPTWVWDGRISSSLSKVIFDPIPKDPKEGSTWFFSSAPKEGVLELILRGDWVEGSRVQVSFHAQDPQLGREISLRSECLEIGVSGSAAECARRLCNLIQRTFEEQLGLGVDCTVEPVEDPSSGKGARLIVKVPNGSIRVGHLTVCVQGVRPPLIISKVDPSEFTTGDVIKVFGRGFGSDPDDLCLVVLNDRLSIPLRVLASSGDELTARVGPIPPKAQAGPLMLGVGDGALARILTRNTDVLSIDPAWVWVDNGGPSAISEFRVTPIPTQPEPPVRWVFGPGPEGGVVGVTLSGDWNGPTWVNVEAHLHDPQQGIGYDVHTRFRLENGGTVEECAKRICEFLKAAFLQSHGVVIDCDVVPRPLQPGTVDLVLGIPGARVTWGNVTVCLEPAEPRTLRFDYTHHLKINGIDGLARATGLVDLDRGQILYDGVVEDYSIPGYRWWPVSWLTTVLVSGGPIVSLEKDEARNLFSLTDGQLGYQVLVRTRDDFASINTDIDVVRKGDVIQVVLHSEGRARYPEIVGMADRPLYLWQDPNEKIEGFTETGVKYLKSKDGSLIASRYTADFPNILIPGPQVREVSMKVLGESKERKNVRILLESVVRPAPPSSLAFEYQHDVTINGVKGVATATGILDLKQGRIVYDGNVPEYSVPGYRWWPVSWLTTVLVSGGPVVALEQGNALNLLSLTRGELGYEARVTTQDRFADLVTDIQVTRQGNRVIARLQSSGVAEYPEIIGMSEEPLTLYQRANPDGGFTEYGVKHLITRDGQIIQSPFRAEFPTLDLPESQIRRVNMQVLSESEDHRQVRIQLDNTVTPVSDTPYLEFTYRHEVKVNEGDGLAQAVGLMNPLNGDLIYDGWVEKYSIPGYAYWPVSWLTTVLVSGGPVIALTEQGGLNLLDATEGRLGHGIRVLTRDNYATIDTLIRVTREGNHVHAHLVSEGKAEYPRIVGMADEPLQILQVPDEGGGFTETGVKKLVTESGEIIRSGFEARFSGVDLKGPQVREATLSVLGESRDHSRVRLHLNNSVKPLPENYLKFEYEHQVRVNGGTGVARARGIIDLNRGELVYVGDVPNYSIPGYRWWPVSWLTTVLVSGGPVFALEEQGGQNFLTLTEGNLGYDGTVQTRDEFAQIDTEFQVLREGDTVIARLISTGKADYPEIIGMGDRPLLLFQRNGLNEDSIVEEGVKELIAADGSIVTSGYTAQFKGLKLAAPQIREVHMDVLRETENHQFVKILLRNTVRPLPENSLIFDYRHEIDINQHQGLARAIGVLDFGQGDLIYNGYIPEYRIPGYKRWPTSWLTTVLTSGGPIVALERGNARNLWNLTEGKLGYEVQVLTRDRYSEIQTEIQVTLEEGRILARLKSSGRADYPEIVGMGSPPMVLVQTPLPNGGFVEQGEKHLVAESGEQIVTQYQALFSTIQLPAIQRRVADLGVLYESDDHRLVRLHLRNFVEPFGDSEAVFAGLKHRALGNASLVSDGDRLVVTQVGRGGEDGVAVDLGEAEYHVVSFQTPAPVNLPEGASLKIHSVGEIDGEPNQRIWTIGAQSMGEFFGISFAPERVLPESVSVEVRLKGQRVQEVPLDRIPGLDDIIIIVRPEGCRVDPFWQMRPDIWAMIQFENPTVAQVLGVDVGPIDEIIFKAIQPGVQVGALSQTILLGDGLGRITLMREALGMFGNRHYALGQTRFDASKAGLRLLGLGDGGGDGVRVALQDTDQSFRMKLEPVSLEEENQSLRLHAEGRVNGVENHSLGNAGLINTGESLQLFAEFTDLEAKNVRLEVFNQGVLVGALVLPGGQNLGQILAIPDAEPGFRFPRIVGCGKLPPRPLPCFILDFDRPAIFQSAVGRGPLNNGPSELRGDQFRILAQDATGRVESLASYDLTGEGHREIVILDEEFRPGTPTQPHLEIIRVNDGIVVRWTGGGKLYATESVPSKREGWVLVAEESPYRVPLDAPTQFYCVIIE